ncbi:MFS transporter [Paenibacillus agaridevorans]|uniref:MFS transporter n=1 Tax=Paenibacillus agaridevorans TaxID=171404 RepID=UPI002484C576|nr:MFS transporter [Paenibacillus agaridevorans]
MTAQTSAPALLSSKFRLGALLLVVVVAGMSQGLLLPLLSILLDRSGLSSELNGMNSAAMYIGIFFTMFVIEKPVVRFGYKRVIVAGITLVTLSTLLFATTDSLLVWFLLRMLVGIGDSSLHFATQLWIVSSSPAEKRGRTISLYGMAYGTGFSLGPLGINLLPYGERLPFLVSSLFFAIVLCLVLRIPNEWPERSATASSLGRRHLKTYKLAWFVLIPGLLYGLMESSMNSSFPLYAIRLGLDQHWISFLLLAFGIGGLVLQLPLGIWSDRIGRKPVLIGCAMIGAIAFLTVPIAGDELLVLFILFIVAGGVVGSFFSLGLAYAADIVPRSMLPSANVIASVHFSLGSIAGPMLGGIGLRYVSPNSLFLFLGLAFALFAIRGIGYKPKAIDVTDTP